MTTGLPAINGDRLWSSLMEMAKIGATAKGGVCRLTLTDLDKQGRELLIDWAAGVGCAHEYDAIGNLFLKRPGRDNALDPVMTGSHLDSQPTGGKFDGVFGVLAGLEVFRTLEEHGLATQAPLELTVWTNEEGSRFSPPMLGSGVFTETFALDWAYGIKDDAGIRVGDELARHGWIGNAIGNHPVAAYFEAHIEQGPVLEAESKTIGVVKGAQGQRWFEITVLGQEAHAGPTPMAMRKDALVCASRIVQAVNAMGFEHAPHACTTCGLIKVIPGSRNVIPGNVWFTVDMRHPDDAELAAMAGELHDVSTRIGQEQKCAVQIDPFWEFHATPFDRGCIDLVRQGADAWGYAHMDIISGAGHDAVYMAGKVPTGMIFVPCENGISHNEMENAKSEDLAAGCQVLLHAVCGKAGLAG